MNINILRLSPVTKQLSRCANALERIAEAYESHLAYAEGLHMKAPQADTSGPEPEAIYVDDEVEWLREFAERTGRMTPEMREYFDGKE